ncbi:hypothetical protein DK847_15865 [Aestuariivirga litoralis]|uniref:Serine protease n=1 Tax=Aestuariivirga litoralis TaxID=2650924 RepID=A0A2W2BRQ9_9HYPH|nr:serine protease [Aestuariivirga litoralis]PZF76106.1 hypothetical protein DK847_15865 [Aestuariivirga litoralis]
MAVEIDEYSLSSCLLCLMSNGKQIGTATGFAAIVDDRVFLISNWHVFSGRNAHTGQPLNISHAIPDAVRFNLHVREPFGAVIDCQVQLHDEDENAKWIMHPTGQEIDVAAIALPFLPKNIAAYSLPMLGQTASMRVQVSQDVYILGYPSGMSLNEMFPVWKRASIATEPGLDIAGKPFFLVDTASRPGMSGSPVIARSVGSYIDTSGNTGMGGVFTKFIGVYSGRMGAASQDDAQLGVVWKAHVVDEVLKNGIHGSYSIRA